MDIEEVRLRKEAAEDMIADVINGFTGETGCEVSDIYLKGVDITSVGSRSKKVVYGVVLTSLI